MSRQYDLKGGQKAAVEKIGRNMALLSGAGCGKTFVLALRFLRLLEQSPHRGDAVGRIVALTFTEKAALEMSGRVRAMLQDAAAGAEGAERELALRWLEELADARIATIHGFCASVLRAHAVEAGIDPAFAVCSDELQVARMIAEAAEEAILQAVERQDEGASGLLARMAFEAAAENVGWLIAERTRWRAEDYADAATVLERWRATVERQREAEMAKLQADGELAAEVAALKAAACSDAADKLAAFRDRQMDAIGEILARRTADAVRAAFGILNASPGNIGSAKCWGGGEGVKAIRARLRGVIEHVKERELCCGELGKLDEQAAETLVAMARLAAEANTLFERAKRRRGMLDFTDLLEHTGRLLAGNAGVREALAAQVDQLLIDEAQDTDGFQLRLLDCITGAPAGGRPREGRVFLVGDAKQSIYRFRGAQVEEFASACGRLGDDHGETLDVSFRTHRAGTEFVNALFAPLMGHEYAGIESNRDELPPGPSVEVLLAAGDEEAPMDCAEAAGRAQARLAAARIRRMLDSGERIVWDKAARQWRAARAGDIAILFARMTNSLEYERACQEQGIRYYVVAGTGFFQRQEVFDVLTGLRAVDDPRDDVAFVGALRSGLFGVNDNTLMHLAEACGRPYFVGVKDAGAEAELARRLSPAQHEAVRLAAGLIERLHARKDAMGIDALVDELLSRTGYEAVLLAQFGGRRQLGNVRMVADLARKAAAGGMALADFLAQSDELILHQSRYEQAPVAGEAEDVVRMMTIHKAKGLEFPVVFVPDLNAGRQGHRGRLLLRSDWGLTYCEEADETAADEEEVGEAMSYRMARQREDEEQRREDIRKLYVAVTRHKDHLVLVGADWRTKDGAFRGADSYLAMIDEVLGVGGELSIADCRLPIDRSDTGERFGTYGKEGEFTFAVRREVPPVGDRGATKQAEGEKVLAAARDGGEIADAVRAMVKGGAKAPRLAGPLEASIGRVEIAVTALGDFGRCPMMFHWRHELRVPRGMERGGEAAPAAMEPLERPRFDAAALGTLFHRCMELLDFASGRENEALPLLRRAAADLDMDESAIVPALSDELAAMVERLKGHAIWGRLAGAKQVFRELDFAMDCPPVTLRGQIDLLLRDAEGRWRIVDYKSDAVSAEGAAEHAKGYELQMLLYAAAVGRRLGEPPASSALYFLRPGEEIAMDVSPGSLAKAGETASKLARELIAARRSGEYAHRRGEQCRWCQYGDLCGEGNLPRSRGCAKQQA